MAGTTTSTPKKPATGKQPADVAALETKSTGAKRAPAAASSDADKPGRKAGAAAPREKAAAASKSASTATRAIAHEKPSAPHKAHDAKAPKTTNGKPAVDKHDKAVTAKAPAAATRKGGESYAADQKFLDVARRLLDEERRTYVEQAKSLRAEADSLVEEMEPGDIQFDEESGEGGTVTVDRERDLALSAQALVAVEEIDHALAKIGLGTYGICESCGELIPKNRLEALPYARLCISCKSGGLSRR